MTGSHQASELENRPANRDELAQAVAAECDKLAEKWWSDRDVWLWSLEEDPFWEEPRYWLEETRPPVCACGRALGRILTQHEPNETVDVVELLEWLKTRHDYREEHGDRRAAHGYHRAAHAVRETSGLGYPDPDPVLGVME